MPPSRHYAVSLKREVASIWAHYQVIRVLWTSIVVAERLQENDILMLKAGQRTSLGNVRMLHPQIDISHCKRRTVLVLQHHHIFNRKQRRGFVRQPAAHTDIGGELRHSNMTRNL